MNLNLLLCDYYGRMAAQEGRKFEEVCPNKDEFPDDFAAFKIGYEDEVAKMKGERGPEWDSVSLKVFQ